MTTHYLKSFIRMLLSLPKLLFVALVHATVFMNVHADAATYTFAILFDKYPSELSFSVTSLTGIVVAANRENFDDEAWSRKVFTQTIELEVGQSYRLTVQDSYGDGLDFGGQYGIFYGDSLTDESQSIVYKRSFHGSIDEIDFTAEIPVAVPAPALEAPNKAPSPAPTTCRDPDNYDSLFPLIQVTTSNPHFKSADTVWPDTNQFCVSHTSYKGCVNEAREDCQWTFRSASYELGTCRVDPVAACIRNGNCVCETQDFQGGGTELGDGILFHAPLSVTAGDITEYKAMVSYREFWAHPTVEDARHPQRDNFFISRVDFTGRRYLYTFDLKSPLLNADDTTVLFKLHYLYVDVPMKGRIYTAPGLLVDISTRSKSTISINNHPYTLQSKLKKWTCTAVAITSTHLYVGKTKIARELDQEEIPSSSPEILEVGPFSGELFDVRIYDGTLTDSEISEVGQRCAAPKDLHALRYREALSFVYQTQGCDPGQIDLHAGAGGPTPDDGVQTYASGPFSTLWNRPTRDLFGSYHDVEEGSFDEEHMFQHVKFQSYLWEKWFFDNDMITFNQEPYRSFTSEAEVGASFKKFWNNPCLYMHNQHNGWQFPIYGEGNGIGIEKWTNDATGDVFDRDVDAVFDIFRVYEAGGPLDFLTYFSHEGFHAFQGNFWDVYASGQSQWFFESMAEYASIDAFVGASGQIAAGQTMAPAYPLNMEQHDFDKDFAANPHFFSKELSLEAPVRGSNLYGSWILWWFLGEHAGLQHLPGLFFSMGGRHYDTYRYGELSVLRAILKNHNLDLGDVWATHVAHMRTWDFKYGEELAAMEREDFLAITTRGLQNYTNETQEERKTAAFIDPVKGTNGAFVDGPAELEPGPFGWNCLASKNVASGSVLSVDIEWHPGMGFNNADERNHPDLPGLHEGCDDDPRFYQSVVVVHNEVTGKRKYWKMKGRVPPTLHINVGSKGLVNVYILLLPTPPTDYVASHFETLDEKYLMLTGVPHYGYRYKVAVSANQPPLDVILTPPAEKVHGIVKFDEGEGWWPVQCTCIPNARKGGFSNCFEPEIDGEQLHCFSGETRVVVKGRGPKLLKDVELGESILVGGGRYEHIYSFGHRHDEIAAEYLQFLPSKLELSPNHIVFVERKGPIPASLVQIGDTLVGGQQVSVVRKVSRKGVYAPLTPSGTLVVNGVLASSYVAFQGSRVFMIGSFPTGLSYHWLAHRLMLPHRIWCYHAGQCKKEKYTENGISLAVIRPLDATLWLLKQSWFVMALVMLPLALVAAVSALVELLIQYPVACFSTACVLVFGRLVRARIIVVKT